MKHCPGWLPLLLMCLLLLSSGPVHAASTVERVLLISSYSPGFPTFFDQVRGVQEALASRQVRLDIEYMDSKRLYDATSRNNFRKTIAHKLDLLPAYDLVMTADDSALRFFLDHRPLFQRAPLVFFGVNDLDLARSLKTDPAITGVVEQVSMEETIRTMRAMLSGMDRVVAVVDGTPSGQGDLKRYRSLKDRFPDLDLQERSLSEMTFAELGLELGALPSSAGVLLLSAYRDAAGEVKEFPEAMAFLLEHLRLPLFHLWEHGVGQGMIGGKVVSQFLQGRRAGELAVRILDGAAVRDVDMVTTSPNRYLFDGEELMRFAISRDRLPKGSELLNDSGRIIKLGPRGQFFLIFVFSTLVLLLSLLGFVLRRRTALHAAVRDREELFRALFQNNHAVMLLIDPDSGAIADANPAAEGYYGYSREQFMNLRVFDLNTLSRDEVAAEMARARSEKRTYFQFQHRLASGDVRDVEVLTGPIIVRGKSLLYSLVRDVTRRVEAEVRLKRAMQAAETSSRAKGEFLANMSHEVRTPMNGILGMLQLLEGTPMDEQQREYLTMALDSGRSLLQVINDILDLSRVEAGKMELVREAFSLKQLLDGIMTLFSRRADEKGITIGYDLDKELGPVYIGDQGRIRQVLLNLVGNAVKFTEQGRVDVRVRPWSEGPGLLFEVQDSGIGIPEDRHQAIFEPFTQVDGSHSRAYEGSGLGLRIVTRLVRLMGGEVRVKSAPGQGATFYVTIVAEPGEMNAGNATPAPPVYQTGTAGRTLSILVAEDNRVNQVMVQKMLERLGHRVEVVDNGRKAVQALQKDDFDLVLMDIQMPVMDGMEALQRIRSGLDGVARPDIPVLALTAHAMKGERERFMRLGMDGYIAKPVAVQDLQDALENLAGIRAEG